VPRERAVALRQRLLSDPRFRDVAVSRLYRARNGWAVVVCPECRNTVAPRKHLERRANVARTA